jgi:hypothetical protein
MAGETESTRGKPTATSPQIPYDLTWDGALADVAGNRRLASRARKRS